PLLTPSCLGWAPFASSVRVTGITEREKWISRSARKHPASPPPALQYNRLSSRDPFSPLPREYYRPAHFAGSCGRVNVVIAFAYHRCPQREVGQIFCEEM